MKGLCHQEKMTQPFRHYFFIPSQDEGIIELQQKQFYELVGDGASTSRTARYYNFDYI